ncbi:MAG: hypothetical protein RLZZ598_527, partial [Pseudomonadota bacterium]
TAKKRGAKIFPMRRLLILLCCLAVPLHGWAGVAAIQPQCLMAPAVMAMQAAAASADAVPADCCNDAAAFVKTGQPCKDGQACHAPAALPALPEATLPAAVPATLPVHRAASAPSAPLASLWRPPALI